MLLFSLISPLNNVSYAVGTSFQKNLVQVNEEEVLEEKASITLNINNTPSDGESIIIGTSTITFMDIPGETLDQTNTSGGTGFIDISVGESNDPRSSSSIMDILGTLTNVFDIGHGQLNVSGGVGEVTFTTSNTETSATSITFTDGTDGDIVAISSTIGVIGVLAQAQIVDFIPVLPTNHLIYRATINGFDYNYQTSLGTTVQEIVDTLKDSLDSNSDVDCTEDNEKIRCTASSPGTEFLYNTDIIDKLPLFNAINAEFSDGETRTIYKLESTDYTTASWDAYEQSITDGFNLETYLGATTTELNDAIALIDTRRGELEFNLGIFSNFYDITNNSSSDINLDADSYDGKAYVTYQRDGNIYFKEGIGSEELVGAGTNPTITVGNDNSIHIAYENGGNIIYAKKTISWNTEVAGTGSSANIDTDSSNFAHIAYKGDYYSDGYIDVLYTNNTSGSFTTEVIANGWYSGWDGWGATSDYYESIPLIKIDSNGKYHIIYQHHHIDRGSGWTDHSYNLIYSTAILGASSSFGGNHSLHKNSLTIDSNNNAHVLYDSSYYGYISGGVWTETNLGIIMGNPSISADGTNLLLAYNTGTDEVKYKENTGSGFSGTTFIDLESYYPTIISSNGEKFLYYSKSDGGNLEIKLTSTIPVYSIPGEIDNTDNSFVSSTFGSIGLSNLEVGGIYSLMSGSTLVSSGVLVAGSTTGILALNPNYFTNYGNYTLTLSGSFNGTTTSNIDQKNLYIGPFDYRDLYVNQIYPSLNIGGITTNLNDITYANVSAFPGLYFEQTGLGKISFSNNLNLTDSGTIQFLQNLPSYLDMDDGVIDFDPSDTDLEDYGANLFMYFNTGSSFITDITNPEDFVVKTKNGDIIDSSTVLSNIHGVCGVGEVYCSLIFDTEHFTEFDLKPILTKVHIESNNGYSGSLAKSGNQAILSFSGSESLTGVSVKFNGIDAQNIVGNGNSWTATSISFGITDLGLLNFSINFSDISGNTGATVTSTTDSSSVIIDTSNPSSSVEYNPNVPTSGDVIATLTGATESIVVTNNSGSESYTFTDNGSFTFQFRDEAGNIGSTIATVTNINKTNPIVSLNGSGSITIEKGSSYTEVGATWSDYTDGTGAVSTLSGSVDEDIVGTYYIEYIKENSLGNKGSKTRTINVVDTTPPSIPTIITTSNQFVSSTGITINGYGDIDEFVSIYSGATLLGTGVIDEYGDFSVNIGLTEGVNNITAKSYDFYGNYSGNSNFIVITKDTIAPSILYQQIKDIKIDKVNLELKFNEINMGNIPYGEITYTNGSMSTGTVNLDFSGSLATANIEGLNEDTLYNYTITLKDRVLNTKTSTGVFITALGVPYFETDLTETGAVDIDVDGSIGEGGSYNFGGNNLFMYSDPDDENYTTGSLIFSGVTIIVSSGSWDGALIPPTLIDSDSDESATGSEVGSGVTIIQTIKAGSEDAGLSATGGYFEISFAIPGYSSGTTFSLYRSEDGNTWQLNTPDSHCTLDVDLMCTFRTDHLSFFAPGFDNEPDAFSFTNITGANLSSVYESNTITVSGIDTTATVTIVGGEYKIGSGGYTSGVGSIVNGDTVTLRQTSSASYNTLITATLTIGLTSGNFNVTTKASSSGGGSNSGGGGWGYYSKDYCPNGDYSPSYYDKFCGVETTGTGLTTFIGTNDDNSGVNEILGTESVEGIGTLDKEIFTNDLNTCFAGEKLAFPDIANNWAKCYIMYLYKAGIINGKEGNYFPGINATRAEFIKMVLGATKIDYDNVDTSTLNFSDVGKDSWQAKVIKSAIDNGLIDPTNIEFRPDEDISRIEALKILLLSINIKFEDKYETNFTDLKEEWMIKYVEASKNMGLIEGENINGKLIFRPLDGISRAESSKIIVKFILINS